ncbi:MAG: PEP-CTERM sorting domain-containing protein [Verrucomicrobiota bacterium]
MILTKLNSPLRLLFAGILLAGSASTLLAQTNGIWGAGLELSGSGSGALNSGSTVIYSLVSGGDAKILPPGSGATVSTAWENTPGTGGITISPGDNPTFSLGTFNPSAGDTLVLKGAAVLTFQNSGYLADGGWLGVNVYTKGSYANNWLSNIDLPQNGTFTNNPGDNMFNSESQAVNLLSFGLAPGTYLASGTYALDVYMGTDFWTGVASNHVQSYANNQQTASAPNYGAYFVVVPEPGTWVMLTAGLGMLAGFRRRR